MSATNAPAAGLKIYLIVSTAVFGLAFGTAALAIGVPYYNDPVLQATCVGDAARPVALWTWLMVYGITALIFTAALIASILIMDKTLVPFLIATVVFGAFNFAWNIVGAVSLFRDSGGCAETAYPLWACTLACLIITWINMVASCCSSSRFRSK